MMRVPAAWFDSVTTFTIVTAARGWWDINEGRKGTQELQHWKVEYTTTEGRKSEGFLLFFNFDVTSSTIRKSTNTMIDDTGTKGSNCTRTVVRKPAPTYHFIIPPRTTCTITLLEMATSKTHQQMRICISTIPPIPRTQPTADANLHSFSEIPPTCTLLQVACRQKRQAPLISRHTSPPPASSSNWFSSPPPHWRKAKRTVSGAKNRAGVGVPLLAGLHLRQPSTTSSHLVGLEMRCTNTCCGRENGSDGESHPTAGARMDGWRGAELNCLGY
jgi:hypothetical protein